MSCFLFFQKGLLIFVVFLLVSGLTAAEPARVQWGWQSKFNFETSPQNNLPSDNPVVSVRQGFLQGFITYTIGGRRIASFQAVPYGRAPVGTGRFQAPVSSEPWHGIRNAARESPQCIQIDFMTQEHRIRGQEDCLYLEVHTPYEELVRGGEVGGYGGYEYQPRRLPVMVFFHGGSFASGAANLYGPRYLLDQNVILVTVNYRLGPFGFLSTQDETVYGNAGLKDQVLALKWVQENIMVFGGNPASITLFGQSAGAGAVQHHVVSRQSRGLFHRGISHSGSSLCSWAISENARELAVKTGSLFGCQGSSRELVKCLQNVPAEELVTAHLNLTDWGNFPIVIFAPVIEAPHPDAFLSEHPAETYKKGKASKVPWITGFTRYEMGWLFADFIQDSEAVAQLNREWERLGPIFLGVGENRRNKTSSQVANQIRDFYLKTKGNTEISYEKRYEISQMLGDRFFLKGGFDGMYLHSQYTGESVYAYEFSFEGNYSIVQLYGQQAKDWGVAHLDDLIYLLNNTEHFPAIRDRNVNPEEYRMMEVMTRTWVNFATYGKPYVGGLDISGDTTMTWKSIQFSQGFSYRDDREDVGEDVEPLLPSFLFLDLNLTPKMVNNPYVERYKFWNSLQLVG